MSRNNYLIDHKKLICPISESKKFKLIFSLKKFPVFMGTVKKNHKHEFKDMNFYINKETGSVQIYPRISLDKLYFKSHGSGKIGNLWKNHHNFFLDFANLRSNSEILEIGGGHNSIAFLNNKKNIKIVSFDPNRKKKKQKEFLINDFFSENSLTKYKLNFKFDYAIHSHLFEHIYNPESFLLTIHKSLKQNGLHIFAVPNMDKMIRRNIASAMNFEHPFFLNQKTIKILLAKTGFKILEKSYFGKDHSIFYKTKKIEKKKYIRFESDYKKNFILFNKLINNWKKDVKKINRKKLNKKDVFLFGAHIFSQILINNGLEVKNIVGILDNDNNKQGEYLYGTNLKVFDPKVLNKYQFPIIILRAGAYNEEIKNQILLINKNSKII